MVIGHPAGDKVLSELAELVQDNIRSSDTFARWGGEDFVLVCRDTPSTEGVDLAEKLRRVIAEKEFDVRFDVTVSIGAATMDSRETLEQLFARADEALYQAKDKGRTVLADAA